MKLKALISPIALASALTVSGGVAAQDMMIGDQTISEDNMATVQDYCDELATAELQAGAGEIVSSEAEDMDDDDADEPNAIEQSTTSINLDAVTYEQCVEAGLVDDEDALTTEDGMSMESDAEMESDAMASE